VFGLDVGEGKVGAYVSPYFVGARVGCKVGEEEGSELVGL